ncbi:chromosome segregation protein SMC [Aquipuribacter nitratireducens]|uniref:chromosome segregation protein SMC n=1 Tax=Aquipuribacter nitratireducens TaxID=650104 RepID=UPI0030EBE039
MYLSSLTLRGFKSFASSTTLRLEPGITCVVGPNGSGKSNVVDAIAWVLGEQGARSLRGGSMADVVFAGTATRAPLGRAEVVLTFDNADGAIGEGTAEVSVTRTMFRTGGSEYAINGRSCRLLDVQEMLGDAGIGRELHVVVGQGRVDAVLQATPEDRRAFVEEAAGVLKHRKRKEKALRKLAAMDGNLVRLADLTSEISRQLKPLGRQARTARRARQIAADARDARLRLLADDIATARAALGGSDGPGPSARRLTEVASRLTAAGVARSRAEAELARVRPRAAAWAEQLGRARTATDRLRAIARVADERARLLAEPVDGPDADLDALGEAASQARSEADRLAAEVVVLQDRLAAATAARAAAEDAHEQADRTARELAADRARRSEAVARARGQVAALRGRVEAAEAEAERVVGTLAAAEARRAEAAAELDRLRRDAAASPGTDGTDGADDADDADETGDGQDPVAAAVAAHEHALGAHAALLEELREVEGHERVAERERAALLARRDALASTTVPVDATAAVLEHGEGVLGLLSTMLRVEPGHEHALAAALGPDADAVAVRTLEDATDAVERLHDADGGRVALVVPGATPHAGERTLPGLGELDGLALPDHVRPAAGLVLGEGPVADWARHRLARTVVVDDLAVARDVLGKAGPGADAVVVVTLLGDVLTVDALRGGSSAAPSLIERQAVLDEAERGVADAERVLASARADVAAARSRVDVARVALEEAETVRTGLDARMSALAEELGSVAAQVRAAGDEADRARAQHEQVTARRDGYARELEAAEAALVAAETRVGAGDDAGEAGHDHPDDAAADLPLLATRAREARQGETEARLAVRTGEERARTAAERAEAAGEALERGRRELDAAARRRAQRTAAATEARAVLTDATAAVETATVVLSRVTAGEQAVRAARDTAQAALRDAGAAEQALAAEHARLVEAAHAEELARTEQRLRLEQLVEVARDEHGFDADALVEQYGPDVAVPVLEEQATDPTAPTDPMDPTDTTRAPEPEPVPEPEPATEPYDRARQQRRLRAAERALADLGTVNPLAMEEYTALEERHRFLLQQQHDLTTSKKDLLGIIRDVDERVEQVVTAAFADTAREFEQIIPRLFPGGVGRLVLTDPDDMLATGIEVEARPAGKTVKRMSLLSGGERTLVALAFLVALFKARPSPFYVLDEIEAALDDANLGRLLVLLEELRQSSQLIVVTHQKRTMEAADALYGVTMRGDGVSTVVSQRLREVS